MNRRTTAALVSVYLALNPFAGRAEAQQAMEATAAFAPGTVPGTIRYQVLLRGIARSDLAPILGDLDNLEVLAGPFLSQQVAWQDGQVQATTVLTWVMQALRPGPIGVGPTRLDARGLAGETNTVAGLAHGGGIVAPGKEPPRLQVTVSRPRVVVGETLQVRFDARGELPGQLSEWMIEASFPGAWSQPVAHGGPDDPSGLHRPGEPTVLGAWVLIPTAKGKLRIPPASARRARGRSGPDGLLLAGAALASPAASVEVAPLPPPPPGFFGGVGDLRVSRRLINAQVRAGEPSLLEVAVSGRGNFPAMAQPPQDLPLVVRTFAAEVEDRWEAEGETLLGERSWRIPLLASGPGEVVVPDAIVATFNPRSGYHEHRLPALSLTVLPRPVRSDDAGEDAGQAAAEHDPGAVPWLPLLGALALSVLAAGGMLSLLQRRSRRRLQRSLPPPHPDAGQDADQLHRFLDQWLLAHFGTSSRMGVPALVRAGLRPKVASELTTLAESLHRLRTSPGFGDVAGELAAVRTRLVTLLTEMVPAPDTLSG